MRNTKYFFESTAKTGHAVHDMIAGNERRLVQCGLRPKNHTTNASLNVFVFKLPPFTARLKAMGILLESVT